MGVVDWIALAIVVGIIKLLHYVWTNRKRPEPRKRVPLERMERIGKSRAAEREWAQRKDHV